MQTLYEDYIACAGVWRKSMVYKRITSSRRNQKRGCRKWLTFDQLLEVFKSKSVVEALVQRKMSDKTLRRTEVRNHPEVPGNVHKKFLITRSINIMVCRMVCLQA